MPETRFSFRKASETDLPGIIHMLADDKLGQTREILSDPVDARYAAAFAAITADPNQLLAVAVSADGSFGWMPATLLHSWPVTHRHVAGADRKRAHLSGPSRQRARLSFHRMGRGTGEAAWLRSCSAHIG